MLKQEPKEPRSLTSMCQSLAQFHGELVLLEHWCERGQTHLLPSLWPATRAREYRTKRSAPAVAATPRGAAARSAPLPTRPARARRRRAHRLPACCRGPWAAIPAGGACRGRLFPSYAQRMQVLPQLRSARQDPQEARRASPAPTCPFAASPLPPLSQWRYHPLPAAAAPA